MHILYIHQHFALPGGSTGTRSYEFARRWVKAGHQVTIITGHYDIGGLNSTRKYQEIEGVKVVIAGAKYGNKMSFIRRVLAFITFIFAAVINGLKVKNVDVIYTTSTPLTIGISAMALKWLKRKPFVFEVRDQWPEVPIELGIIKNPILKGFLLWLEKRIYLSSKAIVALSPGMADGVRGVIGSLRSIAAIPNCCDTEVFRPDIDDSVVRHKHGWESKFILLHFGALGKVNGLDFLIDAALRLKDQKNIHFVLIGDGSEKIRLIERKSNLNLDNIEFLDSVTKNLLPQYIAACDISMVIIADYPILEHNSANKFFDSLAAGKPVLLNYSGWQKDVLEKAKAGFGCKLYGLDEFIDKVLYLNSHREEVLNMGIRARRVAVEKYDRQKLAMEALDVIEKVKLSL